MSDEVIIRLAILVNEVRARRELAKSKVLQSHRSLHHVLTDYLVGFFAGKRAAHVREIHAYQFVLNEINSIMKGELDARREGQEVV